MSRDEASPFARGETYANGNAEILAAATGPYGLGGINLEGKEYVFEPNSQDQSTLYSQLGSDPAGRPIRCKVVRNVSGVALKPGRIAHFQASTLTPYETRVDGYTILESDRPAGIIDEQLPAAGVPDQDLFYIVIDGPTKISTGATTSDVVSIGDRLVPAAYGATVGDDLGGRFSKQVLTGATSVLAYQIANQVAFAASAVAATTSTNVLVPAVVHLAF